LTGANRMELDVTNLTIEEKIDQSLLKSTKHSISLNKSVNKLKGNLNNFVVFTLRCYPLRVRIICLSPIGGIY